MCRSILSLSKIAHQMWHDHSFSRKKQDNRKNSGGEEVGGGWQYRGSSQNKGISTPMPTLQRDFKNFPSPHYKTYPSFLASHLFLVKISHPPLQTFLKNLIPPAWAFFLFRLSLGLCFPHFCFIKTFLLRLK